jgi:hypothetical protein
MISLEGIFVFKGHHVGHLVVALQKEHIDSIVQIIFVFSARVP